MLGLYALELDGNLLAGDDVGTQVDVTERARADLAANTVFVTDSQVLDGMLVGNSLSLLWSCSRNRDDHVPWSSFWRLLGVCCPERKGGLR